MQNSGSQPGSNISNFWGPDSKSRGQRAPGPLLNSNPEEDNTKIQNAIKEVSKRECIIMGDFNHDGHIEWKSLESTGGEDQQFLFLIQESFLTQHVLESTREKYIRYSFIITKRISGQCKHT